MEAQQVSHREAAVWDPRAKGRSVPRVLHTAQHLILPGTLYLLHKGDRAALDVSAAMLSVSHLNHVRGSEKEK